MKMLAPIMQWGWGGLTGDALHLSLAALMNGWTPIPTMQPSRYSRHTMSPSSAASLSTKKGDLNNALLSGRKEDNVHAGKTDRKEDDVHTVIKTLREYWWLSGGSKGNKKTNIYTGED
jgi:hypothetical protein